MNITQNFEDLIDANLRKDKFKCWKIFDENYQSKNDFVEDNIHEGRRMVLQALDKFNDWDCIDKIDKALKPIYEWYRCSHEYFWSKQFSSESPATTPEIQIIAHKLTGICEVLWNMNGIAPYGEDSVLAGNGSFPNERERLGLNNR